MNMMNNKKTRGAVSVFLVIILVPCLLISSIFVDLGRVHLSKSMAESASDLALNSLLSNYDADLAEWYGIVASCQNIDEFYEESAKFFLRTVSSQGLSDDEILLVSSYYSKFTNDDTIYDLLKAEVIDYPKVGAVDNANLANPTLMKDQIVDFMKYRAPVELVSGIVSKFFDEDGNELGTVSQLKDNAKNEQLVNNKKDYYAAEGELLKAAYQIYIALWEYYESAEMFGLDNEKLAEYLKQMNDYKPVYKEIVGQLIEYVIGTSGFSVYKRISKNSITENTYTASDVASRTETNEETKKTTYYVDDNTINDAKTGIDTAIADFEGAISRFETAAAPYADADIGSGPSQESPVRWWVAAIKACSRNANQDLKTTAQALSDAMEYGKAVSMCTLDEGASTTTLSELSSAIGDADGLLEKYLTPGTTDSESTYIKFVSKLEKVSKEQVGKIKPASLYVQADGSNMSVTDAISSISASLLGIRTVLEDHKNQLESIIEGSGDRVALSTLAGLAANTKTALNNWKFSAETTDTELAKQDAAAINGVNEDSAKNLADSALKVSREAVEELELRLKNIQDQLEKLIKAIDSMTLGGKKITEITASSDVISALAISVDSIPRVNSELDAYKTSIFTEKFLPKEEIKLDNLSGNSHNPNIDPTNPGPVDTPSLLVHFYEIWDDPNLNKNSFQTACDEEKTAEESRKSDLENRKTEAAKFRGDTSKNIKNEIYTYSDETSYSAGTAFIDSIVGLVTAIGSKNFDSIRDDIYVACYITEMFSYATYDREGCYDLLDDEVKLELKLDDNYYTTKYETKKGSADTPETWLSTALTDSYNKSLTNKMINAENDYAYLAEIEYILYGKDTSEKNVKSAFGTIYAIRLILNTVSGFQHFWSGNNATASAISGISNAISLAFGGIVPAVVIKAVLIPILAALETCSDNSRLAAGFPVELYKGEDDWWVSLEADSEAGGYGAFYTLLTEGLGNRKNKDVGFQYSDYLTLFVYTALAGGGEVEKSTYKRIADVIETNIRQLSGKNDYSLKKSYLYFSLDTRLRVDPIMVALPIYSEYDSSGMRRSVDWCTYKIATKRGYS